MVEEPKKKGLFEKAIDLVSNRDEKATAAEAAKKLEEAKKAAIDAQLAAVKLAQEKSAALKQAEDARAVAAQATANVQMAERQKYEQAQKELRDKAAEAARLAAIPKIIAEHTIAGDETLSHVALKHYGNATRPYWMVIYEFNKAVIGANPNVVRPGMVLKVPELPAELKKG
jgi:nucleoid-associated protein YgaU